MTTTPRPRRRLPRIKRPITHRRYIEWTPNLWLRMVGRYVYTVRPVPARCHTVRGLYVAMPRYTFRPAWAIAHTCGCLVMGR